MSLEISVCTLILIISNRLKFSGKSNNVWNNEIVHSEMRHIITRRTAYILFLSSPPLFLPCVTCTTCTFFGRTQHLRAIQSYEYTELRVLQWNRVASR